MFGQYRPEKPHGGEGEARSMQLGHGQASSHRMGKMLLYCMTPRKYAKGLCCFHPLSYASAYVWP
jgi:hypothetical protein